MFKQMFGIKSNKKHDIKCVSQNDLLVTVEGDLCRSQLLFVVHKRLITSVG